MKTSGNRVQIRLSVVLHLISFDLPCTESHGVIVPSVQYRSQSKAKQDHCGLSCSVSGVN
jgi:hypothetical protein